MSDWQVGDLALCVRPSSPVSEHEHPNYHLRKGVIYTVAQVGFARCGCRRLTMVCEAFGDPCRFRKIKPHTPDAEDAETIKLLNGQPAPVGV